MSSKVKIVDSSGREYILNSTKEEKYRFVVYIYKQGVTLRGNFKAYIGKVQRKNGTIFEVPPLLFKKHVYIEKWNPVLDTLNIDTQGKIFSGTVEDYKKGDWKDKKKN